MCEKNKQLKISHKKEIENERKKYEQYFINESQIQSNNQELEKDYLENEIQRLTDALLAVEEEFIMKEDEKTTLIQDYEQKISSLNTEITYMKSQQSLIDSLPKIDTSNVLQEENDLLHQEIKSYKSIKINLEKQIQKLKLERSNQRDSVDHKIVTLKEQKEELMQKIRK